MTIIIVIGLTVLAVFLIFVFKKKEKGTSDYLLIAKIILFGCLLFSDVLIKYQLNAFAFVFQTLVPFYLFPVFIIYGLCLITPDHKFRKKWLWFGCYAVLGTIFILTDFILISDYDPSELRQLHEYPPISYHVLYKGQMIYAIAMLLWLLKKIRYYQVQIKEYYSSIESIQLAWFQNFTWMYMLINFFSLIAFLAYNFGILSDIDQPFLILNIMLAISFFYLSFNGIRQYTLAEFNEYGVNQTILERSALSERSENQNDLKYQTSSLAESEMDKLFEKIKYLFEEENIFHDSELKVNNIAEKLNVTTHNISQTINSKAREPFYDFVNRHRVDYLKSLLTKPENNRFTILALGLDSGFNSKASLNRIFKQHSGQTPKEYQKAFVRA